MKSFAELFHTYQEDETLLEQKQVGIIYHFTKKENLLKLLKLEDSPLTTEIFEFLSWNSHISATRNYSLSDNISNKFNNFTLKDYNIRIVFDGTKLSDKFKISPIAGLINDDSDIHNHEWNNIRVPRSSGEAEEVIKQPKNSKEYSFKLAPYILDIQIYNFYKEDEEFYTKIKDYLESIHSDITVELVRKFTPYKKDTIQTSNRSLLQISPK